MPSKNPSVLLISARADIGGGPRYTLDFARSLEFEYNVFVASPIEEPYGPELIKVSKLHFCLPHRRFSLLSLLKLHAFAKRNKISVVHSHGRGAGFYSRCMSLLGYKVVHTFHGIHKEPTVKGSLKLFLDRMLNPLTDAFVYVSLSEKNEADRMGFATVKPFRIVMPLAPEVWKDVEPQFHSPIRLGSISRFDHMKGIDLLFESLLKFFTLYPSLNWTFVLAGTGDFEFKIPEAIASRIILLGQTNQPLEFLRTLDIYISHSRWEAFNITVIEALSQGLPALISNVPGHEYFIDNKVAKGFDLDKPDQFSENLRNIITMPKPAPNYDWVTNYHSKMNTHLIYETIQVLK